MRDSKSFTRGWLLPILILWSLVFLAFADCAPLNTPAYRLDAQKAKAQLGCASLEQAISEYIQHEANTTHELPAHLNDLLKPPFGSKPFLERGDSELIDPWGNPYQMDRARKPNGAKFVLVKTTAPDGTPISQFGIGPNATP